MSKNYSNSFERLQHIMQDLREKCPWDKKQTIATLRPLSIEEVYELADAIDQQNWQSIKEELGDILLHIFFYVQIARENNAFEMEDVLMHICNKLVHRHPHIYSNVIAEDEEKVAQNWEKLKLQEGKKSLLAGVPKALPSVVKAIRIQEKAKQVGFEWEHVDQVKEKIFEELKELEVELKNGIIDQQKVESELGDVLFSVVNYARFIGVDAEKALEKTNQKFMNRFVKMEQKIWHENKNMSEMTLEEMDAVWNQVKIGE